MLGQSVSSSDQLLSVLLIQEEIRFKPSYSLQVNTRPLDIVYNKVTMSRLRDFFSHSASPGLHLATDKIGGMVGGIDHALLDQISLRLSISAPNIIVPKSFDRSLPSPLVTPWLLVEVASFSCGDRLFYVR